MDWRNVTPSNDPKHLVRGTEIDCAFPDGFLKRFAIYSVRTVDRESDPSALNGGFTTYDVRYRVRDAQTVTDAEVRAGERPKVFGEYTTLDEALAAIEPHRVR